MLVFLLVGTVSAGIDIIEAVQTTYDVTENIDAGDGVTMTYVNHTFIEGGVATYQFESFEYYCKSRFLNLNFAKMLEKHNNTDCTKNRYYSYINREMTKAVNQGHPDPPVDIEDEEWLGKEDEGWWNKWIVNRLRKLLDRINNLKGRVDNLRDENNRIKECSKEENYTKFQSCIET